jgi:hypothetical protein
MVFEHVQEKLMNMRPVLIALGFFSGLWLSACASLPNSQPKIDYLALADAPVSSMQYFSLSGWQSIDERHLIVHTNARKAYVMTLFSDCRNLDYAIGIGLSGFGNSVSAGFDYVLVKHEPACRIKTIQPIDVKKMRAAETARRNGARLAAKRVTYAAKNPFWIFGPSAGRI